ncbi:restriction endonuclease subunit S [Methylomonas koyamae]|uniref:restriction endonuclease subunit S n=1 Tax=Methylomonas koyamae TaxID=702114 RepID=UPI001C8FBC81|nr:restriction endonuclease subunit S [Methylomonas koyamae]
MRKEELSRLCKISNGFAFKSDDYVGFGYRVMRITNVQKGAVLDNDPKFVSDEIADRANNFKLKAGDILISLTGNVGRVGRIQPEHLPAVLNQRVGLIRPVSDEINDQYLFQYLNSNKFEREAIQNSNGVAQLNLSSKWIEQYELPLPPIDDQKRIAHLLGKVEGLIAQRKQHLQHLDDLLKSVFLEMFGDPVRNEKGWKIEPLGKLASIERGRFSPRPRNDPKFFNGQYPFIQTGDISRSNGRLREFTQTLNDLGIKVSKEFDIGTIVIAIVGATIGETAILEIPTYAPDSVIGITPRSGEITEAVFIEFLLRFWKPVLRARAPEAARANINIETLRPLQVIRPETEDRQKFAAIVEKVESLKSRYQKSLTDLENLYGALSQQAFKGKLDLSQVPLPLDNEAER